LQQSRDRRHGPSQPPGHLDQRQPLQVLQLDGPPLVVGQGGQGVGQPEEPLLPLDPPAGRGLVGRQEGLQPRRGLLDRRLQRERNPAGSGELARGVDQRVAEECPQPGGALRVVGAAEPVALVQGPGQGLLDEVVRVELAPQPAVDLHPRQEEQVVPERLQPPSQLITVVHHDSRPLKGLNDGDPDIERDRGKIERPRAGQPMPVGRKARPGCYKSLQTRRRFSGLRRRDRMKECGVLGATSRILAIDVSETCFAQ
jgi:hypothetical protein